MNLIYTLAISLIWIPVILFSLGVVRSNDKRYLWLWIFLLVSALMDLAGYLIPTTKEGDELYQLLLLFYFALSFFSVIVISSYFIGAINKFQFLVFSAILLSLITVYLILSLRWELSGFSFSYSMYSSMIHVSEAFLSAFSLLAISEKDPFILKSPWFWVLSGIFFFSFGSFFIDMLQNTVVISEVYFLRNIVSIFKCIFFIFGAYFFIRKNGSNTNLSGS